MLENASRQFFLVLLALVAGVIAIATFQPALGSDLKGGTQLRYEVPREVLDQLVTKEGATIDQVMEQTLAVITERIDPDGTLAPLVTRSGETGILIELPYFQDKQDLTRVEQRIANLGKLEMRVVADEHYAKGDVKFNIDGEKKKLEAWLKQPGNKELLYEDLRNIRRFNDDAVGGPKPFGKLAWYPHLILPASGGDRWELSFTNIPLLAPATVKAFDDAEYTGGVSAAMKAKPENKRFLIELLALNMDERHFAGEDLDPAGVSAGVGPGGGLAVNYRIVDALASDYGEWSEKYIGKCSAIVLNGVVKSAPRFESRIPGRGQIHGDFTKAEVEELVKVLRTGSLRVEPELQSRLVIGPTLGAEAISRGVLSLAIGSLLVFLFMLWYYRTPGLIACVTLVMNMLLLYAAMLFMQATLTLPGLGGIVLTMGMAVDANVLIYERIREELEKGKELLQAVRAGFEKAMSAILDSNITTFLVGVVLYNVGVGPVRGFAVTLMAGIVTTVFTQFFVTRVLFHYALEKKKLVDYKPRSMFNDLGLDYVAQIKKCFAGSFLVIVLGMCYALFMVPREEMLGLDFTGGANLRMVLAEPATRAEVLAAMEGDAKFHADYPNITVNTVGEPDAQGRTSQMNVRLKLTDSQRAAVEAGRVTWRESRKKAEQQGDAPPSNFEPPYVSELRRVFAGKLVRPAFSDPQTIADANQGSNLQYASINLYFASPIKVADAQQEVLKARLSNGLVTALDGEGTSITNNVRVEWQTQSSTKDWELFEIARTTLKDLKDAAGKELLLSDPFPEAQEIQGRLVNDLRNAAIGALILSWLLVVLYLRVRFHEYRYGIAAVIALVHDVLVTFGVVVFVNHMGWVHVEINLAMIACFLTIIGYSVNDTIVIFDRIRENLVDNARMGATEDFGKLINRAVNLTMSRTLLTTGLTLFVVLAQFLVNWGSDSDLESFAFAMMVGMLSGVYSTVFIAAPVLIMMHKDSDVILPPSEVEDPAATPAT
ncbi:MAG: protein translocase subunit SecD [Planctomycetes bacterium]|nr:protein translocase subunit SecD [Planctomycetota bacterium]